MKPQALTQKHNAFIFIVVLLICSLQSISYANLTFIEGEATTRSAITEIWTL